MYRPREWRRSRRWLGLSDADLPRWHRAPGKPDLGTRYTSLYLWVVFHKRRGPTRYCKPANIRSCPPYSPSASGNRSTKKRSRNSAHRNSFRLPNCEQVQLINNAFSLALQFLEAPLEILALSHDACCFCSTARRSPMASSRARSEASSGKGEFVVTKRDSPAKSI